MNTIEIKKMTVSERLKTMEDIWDSLLYHDEIELPDWHKAVLEERQAKIDRGEADFISLDELKTKYR